jgi:hypothetical protein
VQQNKNKASRGIFRCIRAEDLPVYGTGQGSCASPSVWLQICSILFDCHNQRSYRANYCSPDGYITFKTSMTGFVDDTKGQTKDLTSKEPLPLQQLVSCMQADAQLWGDLLHVSSGTLEISKCNYYVMRWRFKPSGCPTLKTNINMTLHIKNGDHTVTVILTNVPSLLPTKHWEPGSPRQATSLNKCQN